MARLIIPRGLPASGKSTEIKEMILFSSRPIVRVNRDLIRDQLFGTRLNLNIAQENLVSISERSQVEAFLKAGIDVVVDAMHLRNKYVTEWAKIAAKHKAEFVVWDSFLTVAVDECVRRDAQRSGEERLGEDVIRGLHKRFFPIPPLKLDDIKPVGEKYVPDLSKPRTILVDIDGTVTDGPHDRSPYEWLKVHQDKPNRPVIEVVGALHKQCYDIVFLSGRDSVSRDLTEKWLKEYVKIPYSGLFMRKEGDMRKDSIVKMELFDKHIRNNYNVIAVFDDRKQVVETWRSMGLTVFQVADGDF